MKKKLITIVALCLAISAVSFLIPTGTYAQEPELGDDVILGTSVMICGAIITKDPEKLALIAEKIGTDADKLLKNVNIRKSTKK